MTLHNLSVPQLALLALLQKIRIARGLRWQRHHPDIAPALRNFARGCVMAAVLITIYGLVGRLEAQETQTAVAKARIVEVRAIGDGNLDRAETIMKACLDSGVTPIGTAIYRFQAEKSELTTADVPELKSSNTPGAGG